MSFTDIDKYVAYSNLQLTSYTGWISRFITIWKGIPLLASFNHLSEEVFDMYYLELLDEEEVEYIEYIIKEYLNCRENLTN